MEELMRQLILNLADEIVDVCREEPKQAVKSSVPRHSILSLLNNNKIEPVVSLSPSSSSHITQLKVLKQKHNDSCGYYALYNVMTIASAITSTSEEEALHYYHQLRHRTRFWVSYVRLTNQLKKKAASANKYPWTYEHIDKGILERPFITYLMNSGLIQSNIDITVLSEFSFMGMRHNALPMEDLANLSKVFAKYNPKIIEKMEKLAENAESADDNEKDKGKGKDEEDSIKCVYNNDKKLPSENRIHAFLVGQTCHWIAIVCSKLGDHVEVLVFDSRNHNLLTASHEDFVKIIDKHKEKIPDWKKEIYMSSLKDPKQTANLFHDCVLGLKDVITSLLEYNMEGFLSSFEEHVEKSEMKDVWIIPFIMWLEKYWPPPVVESNIIKVLEALGVSKLTPATKDKFLRMVKQIRGNVNFNDCDIPVIQRFERVLSWLEMHFVKDELKE